MSMEKYEVRVLTPDRTLNTTLHEKLCHTCQLFFFRFHREGGQIFRKTVEFMAPRNSDPDDLSLQRKDDSNMILSSEDVKVYLVDPREESPSQMELVLVYQEQIKQQGIAVQRVDKVGGLLGGSRSIFKGDTTLQLKSRN